MPDLSQIFTKELLGKAIKSKRTTLKISISELAVKLSLSKDTVSKIEKGEARVQFDNILKVMEFLGLSFQILSDDSNQVQTKQPTSDSDWY